MEKYYCNGICESCEKGKYYNDEHGEYNTCDPDKVKELEIICPVPNIKGDKYVKET